MQLSSQEAEKAVRAGVEALRQGRPETARSFFETVTATGRAGGQTWLLLAVACRAQGDRAAEEAAVDRLLALEPRLARAHIMKADCRAKAGDERAAVRFYKSAFLLAEGQKHPPDMVAELQRAEADCARLEARFADERESLLAAAGLSPDKRSRRFQKSLDIIAGTKRIFVQEPTTYYFPELPQIEFYDPDEFSWVPSVGSAANSIRSELTALLNSGALANFRPYIKSDSNSPRLDDNKLLDSSDWSALFLCENGKPAAELIALCPATWAAVQAAPLQRVEGAAPTVMFSLLRAGARIQPHTGMLNTRLTCHLPLIVPPGCGFRVGSEVRAWEEGKLLIFDDTIEHEAWNEGEKDRVVLIFDIWRPELSERERSEVSVLLSGAGQAGS